MQPTTSQLTLGDVMNAVVKSDPEEPTINYDDQGPGATLKHGSDCPESLVTRLKAETSAKSVEKREEPEPEESSIED